MDKTPNDELLARLDKAAVSAIPSMFVVRDAAARIREQAEQIARLQAELAAERARRAAALKFGIKSIDFHGGHGQPTLDRASAELFNSLAKRALDQPAAPQSDPQVEQCKEDSATAADNQPATVAPIGTECLAIESRHSEDASAAATSHEAAVLEGMEWCATICHRRSSGWDKNGCTWSALANLGEEIRAEIARRKEKRS